MIEDSDEHQEQPYSHDTFKRRLEAAGQLAEHKRSCKSKQNGGLNQRERNLVRAMMRVAQNELIKAAEASPPLAELRISERTLLGRARDILDIDDDDSTGYNIGQLLAHFSSAWNESFGDVYRVSGSGINEPVYYFKNSERKR